LCKGGSLPKLPASKRQPNKLKNLESKKQPQIRAAMAWFCLACALANPATLPALGIRLPDQDAFAAARGNAFAATADDPAAIYSASALAKPVNTSVGTPAASLAAARPVPPGPLRPLQRHL
jgi:hypothetical protein